MIDIGIDVGIKAVLTRRRNIPRGPLLIFHETDLDD